MYILNCMIDIGVKWKLAVSFGCPGISVKIHCSVDQVIAKYTRPVIGTCYWCVPWYIAIGKELATEPRLILFFVGASCIVFLIPNSNSEHLYRRLFYLTAVVMFLKGFLAPFVMVLFFFGGMRLGYLDNFSYVKYKKIQIFFSAIFWFLFLLLP